jgi:hypothetical protein
MNKRMHYGTGPIWSDKRPLLAWTHTYNVNNATVLSVQPKSNLEPGCHFNIPELPVSYDSTYDKCYMTSFWETTENKLFKARFLTKLFNIYNLYVKRHVSV